MKTTVYPRGRWTLGANSSDASSAEIANAPLRQLFWGEPQTTLVEEATARVEQALRTCAESIDVQLFDDLYQVPVES